MNAIISPILNTNTGPYRTSVRALATGIRDKLVGMDVNGSITTTPELATRFVLGLSGAPLSPEVDVRLWIGWHPLTADNIRDRYFDLQFAGLHQVAFNPPPNPVTEAWMITRLKQYAHEQGCVSFWLVRPGDSLVTANGTGLLAKFVPF